VALLAATTPAVGGTLAAPAAIGTSNTINGNLAPCNLKVINGAGSPVNVTIVDPGTTPAGNTGDQAAVAVANGAAKWFLLTSAFVNPSDNLITVTLDSATSVTYELIP
jgi:hypothetical protein